MTKIYNTAKNLTKRLLLRKSQTKQEGLLWEKLRRNNLGVKWRRQYSVGPYVLDFYCPNKKLAIELDGGQHKENIIYDEERTIFINSASISVLRFWNNEIDNNLDVVLKQIISKLNSLPLARGGAGRGELYEHS